MMQLDLLQVRLFFSALFLQLLTALMPLFLESL
jgi:hypothetical protein